MVKQNEIEAKASEQGLFSALLGKLLASSCVLLCKHGCHLRGADAATSGLTFLLWRRDCVVATEALEAARCTKSEHLSNWGHTQEFLTVDGAKDLRELPEGWLQVAIGILGVFLQLCLVLLVLNLDAFNRGGEDSSGSQRRV